MDPQRMTRAQSFGGWAARYERYRPGYPDPALALALPPDAADVVDLGAGTGKLTRQLLAPGRRVVAVEPDPRMAEVLRAWAEPLGVEVREGRAETLPLEDASADAVLVAQAWHWFDAPRAAAEARRVLRPDGRLTLLWNLYDDEVPWMAELVEEAGIEARRGDPPRHQTGAPPGFRLLDEAVIPHAQRLTVDDLVAQVLTHSRVAVLPADGRAAITEVVERVASRHADAAGALDVPLVTDVAAYGLSGPRGRRAT